MKHFVNLLNFELGRFWKIYVALAGITIATQLAGTFLYANSYLNDVNQSLSKSVPKEQFLENHGYISMSEMTFSTWFSAPISLCIAALIFCCFFIWYRDWYGKNTFIYRLLMLPTSRLTIYFSKVSAIFLMVLGLIALELLILPVGGFIIKSLVPIDLRIDMTIMQIINAEPYLHILIPNNVISFLIAYGIGLMALFVLFTAILLERSYKWKGVIAGVIYCLLTATLFLLPFLLEEFFQISYFYPTELVIVEFLLGVFISGLSIGISHYLLNNKVSV